MPFAESYLFAFQRPQENNHDKDDRAIREYCHHPTGEVDVDNQEQQSGSYLSPQSGHQR